LKGKNRQKVKTALSCFSLFPFASLVFLACRSFPSFPFPFALLLCLDGVVRTNFRAAPAIGAELRIDHVYLIAFADGVDRALADAGPARYAILGNPMRHQALLYCNANRVRQVQERQKQKGKRQEA